MKPVEIENEGTNTESRITVLDSAGIETGLPLLFYAKQSQEGYCSDT